ncbi:hypothetical protein L208DRAFT_1269902, partial [Tricholoma matsutake]
ELHEVWWPQLPDHVKWTFTCARRTDCTFCPLKYISLGVKMSHLYSLVASTIISWWLQWQENYLSNFLLSLSLCHFGAVALNTCGCFIFKHGTYQESNNSYCSLGHLLRVCAHCAMMRHTLVRKPPHYLINFHFYLIMSNYAT